MSPRVETNPSSRGPGHDGVAPTAESMQHQSRHSESGASLVEILVALFLAGLLLVATTSVTIAWVGREAVRSDIYSLQTQMQTARMEAVSRLHTCEFTVNTATRRITEA